MPLIYPDLLRSVPLLPAGKGRTLVWIWGVRRNSKQEKQGDRKHGFVTHSPVTETYTRHHQ